MGMLPGAADLVVVVHGLACFMEIKSPTGVQSVAQFAFQLRCAALGLDYTLVRNIDAALRVLRSWNAIRPDAGRRAA